ASCREQLRRPSASAACSYDYESVFSFAHDVLQARPFGEIVGKTWAFPQTKNRVLTAPAQVSVHQQGSETGLGERNSQVRGHQRLAVTAGWTCHRQQLRLAARTRRSEGKSQTDSAKSFGDLPCLLRSHARRHR